MLLKNQNKMKQSKLHLHDRFKKLEAIVRSCKTETQLECCHNIYENLWDEHEKRRAATRPPEKREE